jgi:hypothetical protein
MVACAKQGLVAASDTMAVAASQNGGAGRREHPRWSGSQANGFFLAFRGNLSGSGVLRAIVKI